MPGDSPAIDELRRRVQKDPASIAFAHLAEELRKAGQYDEAVRVCRTGLERHPTYLSARVTLGRTLLALQHYGEARTEIEYVLHAAPDNLLALKCMTELEAHPSEAAPEPPVPPPPEPPKPDLRVQTAPEPAHVAPPVVTLVAEAAPEPAEAGPHVQSIPEPPKPDLRVQTAPEPAKASLPVSEVSAPPNGGPPAEHPAVGEFEDWQARIQADRARRTGGSL